jgi:hypothetical protein
MRIAERGEGNLGPKKTTAKSTGFFPIYVFSLRGAGIPQFAETFILCNVRGIAFRNTRRVPGFFPFLKMKADQKSFQDIKRFFKNLLFYRKDNETNLAIYIVFCLLYKQCTYKQRNEMFCYCNTSQKHDIERFKCSCIL